MSARATKKLDLRQALLLIGSPRGKASISRSLGRELLRRLESAGLATVEMTAAEALRSTEEQHRLHKAIDKADLVVVSFPLYVDQLPAPLIQVLELVAERRKGNLGVTPWAGPLRQKLAAIVQCGFPEILQTRPAVDIMRQFAREAGFEWAGALALGMGGAIGGDRLEKAKGMTKNIHRALDIAAASLGTGSSVPEEASRLAARPLMPRWLYFAGVNWGFRHELKKHGLRNRAHDRPYQEGVKPT
jgi:NAD(P)H-dependent FMN reductase